MIAFDTTALSFLFIPGYKPSKPVKYGKERLQELVNTMAANQDKIGIPSPALSEFLVTCNEEQTDEFLRLARSSAWIELLDFDTAAAVEVAMRTRRAIEAGDKNEGMTIERTKIKFDRQIVGTAIVSKASKIISDDKDVKNLGERWGIEVQRVEDLPVPKALIPPPIIAMAMEADEKAAETCEPEKPTDAVPVPSKPFGAGTT